MAELFSSDFIESLRVVSIKAKRVSPRGRHAEHRSADMGGGLEFQDYRSYLPGDDIRRVDWNVYRRSGELFLRLFEENEDLPVYVLLDESESMHFERPGRAEMVVAAVSLRQMDRVAIYPFGADLAPAMGLTGGHGRLSGVLKYLEDLKPSGQTNIRHSVGHFANMKLRSGLVVVISDFFDPCGVEEIVAVLSRLRHKLVLVQIARSSDAEPGIDGEVKLVDCETERAIDLTVSGALLERYRQAYERFYQSLHDFAVRGGGAYLRLDVEVPILEQLDELFINGTLTI